MADYDVAIVGAGAAGLTLANMLGRLGLRIVVVEKQVRQRSVHKGEVLQPRSLEILRDLNLLAPLVGSGAVAMERLVSATADGRELMSLDYRVLPGDFRHCLVHYYKDMTETLAAQAAPSVRFCRGATAEDLIYDGGGRVAGVRMRSADRRQDVTATVTVAADGHGSRLRQAAGIDATVRQYDHHLVALDLGEMPDLGPDIVMYLTGDGARVLFQMPRGRARLYAQIPVGGFRDIGRSGLGEWIGRLAGSVPALAPMAKTLQRNVADVQVMPAVRLSAASWTRPGLVLLGDAAHCVHPMVGQGMNAAIADAWTLGTHLSQAAGRLTERAADDALLGYERARRPRVEYVARLSHNLATLFAGTSLTARTVYPFMLRRNRSNARLRYRLTYNVAGLGSRPFSAWDWMCASGLVPDPRRGQLPAQEAGGPGPRPAPSPVAAPSVPGQPTDYSWRSR